MNKPAVLETLDPQTVTKAVTDALPKMELLVEAKERGAPEQSDARLVAQAAQ